MTAGTAPTRPVNAPSIRATRSGARHFMNWEQMTATVFAGSPMFST